MKSEKLTTANIIHLFDGAGVSPETVVHGAKCDAAAVSVESGEHHVTSVQRMNKVGNEDVRYRRLMNGKA